MIAEDARDVDLRSARTELEMQLLLDGVARLAGFDFREYAAAPLRRRVAERVRLEGLRSVSGLLERVIHDPAALERLLYAVTSNASAPFHDAPYFAAFARDVVPRLRTYPFVRVWVAGSAADAYPIAILLHEADLLKRTRIYATDATETALAHARAGTIEAGDLARARENYRASGGKRTLEHYLDASATGEERFAPWLAQNVLFARHDLAAEGSFNEFGAVALRASLATFGRGLAYQVHRTLYESIARLGFLCLPSRDTLAASPHRGAYEPLAAGETIFRRVR